jgi:hypothetical protein
VSGWLTVPVTVADPAAKTSGSTSATAVLNDTRIGATIPSVPGQKRAQTVAAFESLTGSPLAAWRVELGAPVASLAATFLSGIVPAGCRVLFDFSPAVDGSDLPVLDSFAASCEAAGLDCSFSFWHEPSDQAGLTAAQFTGIYPLAAAKVRKYAGPSGTYRTIYCQSGGEIATKGQLTSFWPGDEWVDVIGPDLYIGVGLKAFALVAAFAKAHGKPLGACEFGVQATCSTCNNYGTPAQNTAYLASLLAAYEGIAATQPVADLCLFQGSNPGQGNFALTANPYAVPSFQAVYSSLNTTGYLAA